MKNKYKVTVVLMVLISIIILVSLICTNIYGIRRTYEDYTNDMDISDAEYMEEYLSRFDNLINTDDNICNVIIVYLTDNGYDESSITWVSMYDSGFDTVPFDVYRVEYNEDVIYIRYVDNTNISITTWD
jgi:hypothetical protein